MAENVTPVVLEVKDFETREVMMVDYKFDQATDREGQIDGIPRGGQVTVRVKAMKSILLNRLMVLRSFRILHLLYIIRNMLLSWAMR